MRVALLSTDAAVPLGGPRGASVRLRGLAAGLRRQGHEVSAIVAARGDERDLAPLESEGVSVRELARAASLREIDWHYARFQPDLVVERLAPLSSSGAVAAAACGTAHLYDLGATERLERAVTERGHEAHVAVRDGLAASLGAIAANEDALCWARLFARDGFPMRVVENAASHGCFCEPDFALVGRLRAALRLESSRFVVGYLGSLGPEDGVEWLLEALARVTPPVRPHLLLVGDGPVRNDLIRMAFRDRVPAVFASWVPHPEIPAYLALCDVVVVPGFRGAPRGAPIGLIEAMAAARPVVAARTAGTARILFDGHSGLLVEPGDAGALAAALDRLARSPAAAARFGAAARRSVSQRHVWSEGADLLLEFAGALPARRDLAGEPGVV